jgi:hypothetical protein
MSYMRAVAVFVVTFLLGHGITIWHVCSLPQAQATSDDSFEAFGDGIIRSMLF